MTKELVVSRTPTGRRIELLRDGQAVSWTDVLYRRLRIGRAVLSFGGWANVGTKKQFRNRGYSRRVLERAVEMMTDDGLDLSMLFGIADYYHKFGFRTTLSDYRTDVPGRMVVGLPMEQTARRIPRSRHGEILRLYDRDIRRAGFGTVRRKDRWTGFGHGFNWRLETVVVGFYRGKRLTGYVAFDDEDGAVNVSEASADGRAMALEMLGWLGRLCRRRVVETLHLHLSPDHALSQAAIEHGGTFTRKTHVGGGGMMRILNLGSTMAGMMSELLPRWATSPLADDGLDLTLATDLGPAELTVPARKASAPTHRGRVHLSQDRLVQLLTGYLGGRCMADRDGVRMAKALVPAMEVLFPCRSPHILGTNRF